jgi:hypothetical protein
MTRDVRLGDDVDDWCVRCKRVMNHAVVSVMNGAPAKVRCRTCHSDHDFRNEQAPPPKVDPRKAALFAEVLKKVDPAATPVEADEVVDGAEVVDPIDGEELAAVEAEAGEPEAVAEVEEVAPAPAPKAKAKAKGRGKK